LKQAKLTFYFIFIGFTSIAQQNTNLYGVHYYYNLPSIGSLVTNTNHRAMTIHEIGNKYFLSGVHNMPEPQAGMVVINKNTNTIDYDYFENQSFWSWSEGGVKITDNRFLFAYNPLISNGTDDSLRTIVFDSIGNVIKHKYATALLNNRFLTNINSELSALSSSSYGWVEPIIFLIKNDGTITDSIRLPLGNVFANLPVLFAAPSHTFSFKNEFLTFGFQQRLAGLPPNDDIYNSSICLWRWNQDSVTLFKEIYENFAEHNSEVSCDFIQDVDCKKNNTAIITERTIPCNLDDIFKIHLTFLDTNLTVKWIKKIGNLPSNRYCYDEYPRVNIDTLNSVIVVSGNIRDLQTYNNLFFIEKWTYNGGLLYRKVFTIGQENRYLLSMNLCENGDFLFSGTCSPEVNQFAFFTYRTGPDGYHPDGEYLGIAEVTATPTEIGIFPNPSDGIFQVSSLSEEPMLITMLDQQGKHVVAFELNELSSKNSFDLSEQAPGVYFAHISQGENQWVKKLVVR
jgi:hypothetical protein